MSMATPQVYVTELERLKFGRPLYNPEHPVNIGDVRFFQQDTGNFRPLFNVFLEAEDQPYARHGSLNGFEPLSKDYLCLTTTSDYFPPQPIQSSSVETRGVDLEASATAVIPAGAGITFSCANKLGATLLLRAATTRADLDNNHFIHEYIVKHIDSWYEFAWRLGYRNMQATEGSLVLIKGCDKTNSWAHATFAERTKEASVFFEGGYLSVGGTVRLQGAWSRAVSAIYREAPLGGRHVQATILSVHNASGSASLSPGNARNDNPLTGLFPEDCPYTVFARVYRIKRRSILGMVKSVTVEVNGRSSRHQLPRSTSGVGPASFRALVPSTSQTSTGPGDTENIALEDQQADLLQSSKEEEEDDVDDKLSITVDPDPQLGGHVLDHVLDYILKTSPEAEVAIATDDELFALCPESTLPYDIPAMLDNLHPECSSLIGGVATLHQKGEPGPRTLELQSESETISLADSKTGFNTYTPLVNVEKSGPSGVLDTNILSEGFFTHMNRVNCAAPFAFGQQMVYGTDNGVYMSDVPVPSAPTGARKEPVKMLSLSKVTQVDILEEYQLLLVLSEGRVFTLPMDTLDPYDPMAGLKHAKRISSHTTFFKAGSCFNKTSVCVVKSSPLSTTIKLFEPIVENRRGRAKPSFRKLVQGKNDSLQIYREFIIPTESSSVRYMNMRLIVGCTNGFEIVDLETLDTQGLFNPADESLGFVSARKTPSRPMAIFKINSEFLVCYDEFAFYINRYGFRSKQQFMVHWQGQPTGFAIHHPYILAFEPTFVEICHVETGAVAQVIQGNQLRLLFADASPSKTQSSATNMSRSSQLNHITNAHTETVTSWRDEIVFVSDDLVMTIKLKGVGTRKGDNATLDSSFLANTRTESDEDVQS